VRDLTSSNTGNAAHFIGAPVRARWPFYYELDGSANNRFIDIPPVIAGASWIATRRLSRPENRAALRFRISEDVPGADVWILYSSSARPPAGWAAAGFAETGIRGEWRDDDLRRVPFRLRHRRCSPGEGVRIAAGTLDYVVLARAGVGSP
jgi:hypothetical protein